MERRLEQLIEDFERVSNVRNLDSNNPIVMRISHPTNASVHVIVCSLDEPKTLVLPLNVTWFVYDPLSPNYRQALRRESKNVDPAGIYEHEWINVTTYDEVFVDQFYDEDDTELLSDNSGPSPAQTDVLGIARLSHPADVRSNPVVVTEGDPRLSDARVPLAHTHPERPARQLKTSVGVVTIEGSDAPTSGAVLVATSDKTAEWRKLRTSDIR